MEAKIRKKVKEGKMDVNDICIIPCDRQDKKTFAQHIVVNTAPTLTCNNQYLLVLSVADVVANTPDRDRTFFRKLTGAERFTLQGLPKTMALHLSKRMSLKASGNAYPPPLITATLLPLLKAMANSTVDLTNWPTQPLPAEAPPEVMKKARRLLVARGRVVNKRKFEEWQQKTKKKHCVDSGSE